MTGGASGTPQARKLGLASGQRVWFDHAASGWALADAPAGLVLVAPPGDADLIISFFSSADQLPVRLPGLAQRIFPAGMLWIAWPRRAAGHVSDITDNVVRTGALALGLVDTKVAAIDDDWSGLKVVWRLENRGSRKQR